MAPARHGHSHLEHGHNHASDNERRVDFGQAVLRSMKDMLARPFGIDHSTVPIDRKSCSDA